MCFFLCGWLHTYWSHWQFLLGTLPLLKGGVAVYLQDQNTGIVCVQQDPTLSIISVQYIYIFYLSIYARL